MTRARIRLILEAADPEQTFARARAVGLLPEGPPTRILADGKKLPPETSLAEAMQQGDGVYLSWGMDAQFHHGKRLQTTSVVRSGYEMTPQSILAAVAELPFEACTTDPMQADWWQDAGTVHGWGLFLKGAGHRLVSPRVVDRGTWRRLRDEARDVTLFQFHAFDADQATALAQARPGHELLAPAWRGGHYAGAKAMLRGQARPYKPNLYERATQTSVVLVTDGEVAPETMGIAAATRVHQIFDEPVAQVRFVYMDEATARRQLPALWLFGFDVRAMTAAGEQRIDLAYQPPVPPPPPAWVGHLAH